MRLATRPHLPRRSIRLRLTAFYGGLFLVAGAGLLAVTYLLVREATAGASCHTSANGAVACVIKAHGAGSTVVSIGSLSRFGAARHAKGATPLQLHQLTVLATTENANDLHQLLLYSVLALAVMAVLSVVLGWLIAGRVLRPLRTITITARTISATNLHRRLALEGPDDELKELGDTFDELLARLETFVQAQRQFVASASHELRTPLALQRTLIQLALADPDADMDSLRAVHERVLASGTQQERLLDALLTLARGQTGIETRAPFDLAALTGEVLFARRDEALGRGVELRSTLTPAPMTGDPRLVERLVANLVDNALRHNVEGGEVAVMTASEGGRVRLAVRNTGPIVPRDDVECLVQPFQRPGADRTRHGEGFGLGLSIVQAIATAHGAALSIDPQARGGLDVAVTFPQSEISAALGGDRVGLVGGAVSSPGLDGARQ
jgi:signal transduction histidine kinase